MKKRIGLLLAVILLFQILTIYGYASDMDKVNIQGTVWNIDVNKTTAANNRSMRNIFGTAWIDYEDEMKFYADNSFCYYIGAGIGGKGTYSINNEISYEIITYEEEFTEYGNLYLEDGCIVQKDDGLVIYWKKTGDLIPSDRLLNGDFSEYAGKYSLPNGTTTELLSTGLIANNIFLDGVEIRAEDIIKTDNGTYMWLLSAYVNGEYVDGVACVLYPINVKVVAWDGHILDTDTTKPRFWCGNDVICDADYIYTKTDEAAAEIKVVLNGEEIKFDQPPMMINNRVMVPVRKIFEAMGAIVNWNENTQTVTSTKNSTIITMQVGDYIINKNGVESYFNVATQIVNDRTLVPVRAVAESLGAEVIWNDDIQTVFIDTSAKINAIIVNADEDITGNDAAFVKNVLLNNKLAKVNENNFHWIFEPSETLFNAAVNATILQAGESDITYFYYSGHGGKDGHISPTYNNETHDISFTLTPQEIIDTLERIPGTIVVVLDSCYSGAINDLPELDRNKFKILTASDSNSYSYPDNLTHISSEQIGKFTEAFLNALGGLEGTNVIYNTITGRDGKVKADYNHDYNVTLSELFMYIDENMDKKYKDKDGNVCYQNPTCSDVNDNTVIYKY